MIDVIAKMQELSAFFFALDTAQKVEDRRELTWFRHSAAIRKLEELVELEEKKVRINQVRASGKKERKKEKKRERG